MVRLLALLAISAACAWAVAASPCLLAARMIAPCVGYLTDRELSPYGPCCSGVMALNLTASTRFDRAVVCNCLKLIAVRLPPMDPIRASSLPAACGVHLNVTLSPFIDCNSLHHLEVGRTA